MNQHFPDASLVPTIHIRAPPSAAENDRWTMETEETGGGRPGSAAVWCFMPQPGGYGSMHMKFILVSPAAPKLTVKTLRQDLLQLFYKTGRLRVVIASANLVSYDWEYIENVCPSAFVYTISADCVRDIDRFCARPTTNIRKVCQLRNRGDSRLAIEIPAFV